VAFGPRNLGLPNAEVQRRVDWALQAVGIADLTEQNPAQLSGGQKQCVAIATVLAMQPTVLVLDEPTAHLDPENTAAFVAAARALRRSSNAAVLSVAHSLQTVVDADRIVVLREGLVVESGRHADLLAQAGVYAALVGAAHEGAA